MTLVPIIYTSLLIFSALLLFVIIVSYISFKLKPQRRPEIVHASTQRQVHVNRVHNSIQVPQQVQPRPIVIRQEQTIRNVAPQKVQAQNNYPKNSILRNTKRLEIMNTSEYFQNQQRESYEPKYERKREPLIINDSNIFDFYADKPSSKFSSASSY
jgi:hypothetical protein